jgi:4-hydroxybenzoate polyprenyltransferase
VLFSAYATVMGTIVAGQSRHWRWAVAIFVLGLPAALVYSLSRLRDADIDEPLSALRG